MAKSCMVASLVTCQNLMAILARLWSGYHGQILVASLVTCQNLMVILARFWSFHHGKILPGSITSDLSEPYGNLGKILVRSLWPNLTFKTSHELDKIVVQFSCLSLSICGLARICHNLAIIFERLWSDHFGKILACWNPFRLDKILPCFLSRLYLDQILPDTLEELGVNLGKILANKNLARQSWLLIQDTCKILGNFFSRVIASTCPVIKERLEGLDSIHYYAYR